MPGFDFSNHTRNAALHARGVPLPKATSTGTTIVGCIFDGGVVVSLNLTDPHEKGSTLVQRAVMTSVLLLHHYGSED
jgi:hypothetical protein